MCQACMEVPSIYSGNISASLKLDENLKLF